jgi:uncharacterized RDD family membrane protein YckC
LQVALAPWWKRLVAILIDGLILGFASWIVILPVTVAINHNGLTSNQSNVAPGRALAAVAVAWIIGAVPSAIYYGALNGSRRGQTLGKMALSIAVRDASTGAPIGFWRGLGRFLITIVFSIALVVPYLLDSLAPLWDRRRQSWHDKVAHSVVVDLKP